MNDRIVSDIQSQAEGKSCISDTTRTRLWTYWRSDFENTSNIRREN